MSQAHIPQPDSQSSAPAEAFDSTADAPHGGTVSGIGVPAGPPQEISPHTGAINTIDITIQRQFMPIDTIIWSVNQVKGTLLWHRPIHPEYAHSVLAYLQVLYNAWGGSLEYNFKIAGTGFHAGAIAIVRIPPNRHPNEFVTAESWGPFEYVVLDPKMLEIASLDVSDQRPIMYHYQPFKSDDRYSFGGWIAMYVLIPLNTSATGSQQIAIQAFCRPGQSFQFSQLVSPLVKSEVPSLPSIYDSYFDFFDYDLLCNTSMKADKFTILPKSVQETKMMYNCFDLSGNNVSPFDYKYSPVDLLNEIAAPFSCIIISQDPLKLGFDGVIPQCKPTKTSKWVLIGENMAAEQYSNITVTESVGTIPQPDFLVWSTDTKSTLFEDDMRATVALSDVELIELEQKAFTPKGKSESIVSFSNVKHQAHCVQTQTLAKLFSTGALDTYFSNQQCLLFILVEKTEGLGVGYVKLYKEGVFTARESVGEVTFDLSAVRLVFDSFILRTGTIPVSSQYNTNRLLLGTTASASSRLRRN